MTAAAAELQTRRLRHACGRWRLAGLLGGAKIYDYAPALVGFPYITFGRSSVFDWSTGTESGTEHILTLHVWSKAHGKKEIAGDHGAGTRADRRCAARH